MFAYSAFELSIGSDIELPGLRSASNDPEALFDLRVLVGNGSGPPPTATLEADIRPERVDFDQFEIGRISVRAGREIVVAPHASADVEAIGLFVSGPALAVALHQRGHLVLHASAVDLHGHAVAILGEKGAGKSTLAAALVARGHRLISDDIVVLGDVTAPEVLDGNRTLKLQPDAARAIGVDPATLRRVHPSADKFVWPATDATRSTTTAATRVPLSALVVVQLRERLELEELTAAELFIEAVRHTYGSRFDLMRRAGMAPSHFKQVTDLVRAIRGVRLSRTGDLARLGESAALVETIVG